jgi:group I intron endonuclease
LTYTYFTIYKITNLLDGKFYIGKHQTKNLEDSYFGSGKLLKRAIQKHGKENFKKEYLEIHMTEEEMNAAEKRLVVICDQSYNLCEGGKGGFGFINSSLTTEQKSVAAKKNTKNHFNLGIFIKGKPKSEKHKQNISLALLGKKPGNAGLTYKQKNHNPASHPRGPRGPYRKSI